MTDPDALLERLRTRAADPGRRVDVRRSAFGARVATLDLGGLLSGLSGLAAGLDRVVAANTTGHPVPPDLRAVADGLEAEMDERVSGDLPPKAQPSSVAAVEKATGSVVPTLLRRAWTEIADGGFGPGSGLCSATTAAATYRSFRASSPGPRRSEWPPQLLPVTEPDPGCFAVDLGSGHVVAFDPEGLGEWSRDAAWRRAFTEVAPSVEAWLAQWVEAPTLEERMEARLRETRVREARAARERIGAMTPEERAAMGLPEVGWERVVWGGIGLDDDEAHDT